MMQKADAKKIQAQGRIVEKARPGDEDLGPLGILPGIWETSNRGWNLIALPFADSPLGYRLLMNQYSEKLEFGEANKGIPNRGIPEDQFIVGLDYKQSIKQIAVADFPKSEQAGSPGDDIHLEPGLFLNMTDKDQEGDLDIARLATIPHGDSVLALGHSSFDDGPPEIPEISALPIGVNLDLDSPYLEPYKHFHDNPFENLFDPTKANELLKKALASFNVKKTTTFVFDTNFGTGGIKNIPFIVKQADASEMNSTFWVMELDETDADDKPQFVMQYSQVVMLDFFPRQDGMPGLIQWPHISINTLTKTV